MAQIKYFFLTMINLSHLTASLLNKGRGHYAMTPDAILPVQKAKKGIRSS